VIRYHSTGPYRKDTFLSCLDLQKCHKNVVKFSVIIISVVLKCAQVNALKK
jgi:hypothetical protein